MTITFGWKRFGGYEVSSRADKRFRAFNAFLPDGRTIEQHFQCDCKGYQPGGRDWRLGKGKPPLIEISAEALWTKYLDLWKLWGSLHPEMLGDLRTCVIEYKRSRASSDDIFYLSDRFATSENNQARALAEILNELERS